MLLARKQQKQMRRSDPRPNPRQFRILLSRSRTCRTRWWIKRSHFIIRSAGSVDSAVFIDQSESDISIVKMNTPAERKWVNMHTQMCPQRYILRYFGEDLVLDCGYAAANCLGWTRTGRYHRWRRKKRRPVKRMGERFGKALVGKVLTGSADQKVTQWDLKNCQPMVCWKISHKRSQSTHWLLNRIRLFSPLRKDNTPAQCVSCRCRGSFR